MRFKKVKEGVILFLTFALIFVSVAGAVSVPVSAIAHPVTGKSVGTFKFKSNRRIANKCIEFSVPALNAKGTCINSKLHGGDGKAAVYKVSQSNDAVKIAYYRAVVKNKWGKHDVEGSFWTKRALQAYCYPDEFKNEWGNSTYRKAMEKANAAINALSGTEVPDYFQCWVCYPTNDVQPFMVWRYDPLRITMQKKGRHAEAVALDGYNSFEGITYELYKSDKSTLIGEFKLKSNGTVGEIKMRDELNKRWVTKKGKYITVAKGQTYYLKEKSSNDYYELNDAWMQIKPGKDKQCFVTKKDGSKDYRDQEKYAYVKLRKKIVGTGAAATSKNFHVKLINTKNESVSYEFDLAGNETWSQTTKVYAGTYRLEEDPVDGYLFLGTEPDEPFTIDIHSNDQASHAYEITVKNEKNDSASFSLKKRILPGLSAGEKLSGFRFSITGVYENAGTLSAGDVCRLPDPDVSPSHSGGYISWNGWQYDTGVISSINAAAQAADGVAPGYSRSFSISATNSGTEHWTEKEDHGHTEYWSYTDPDTGETSGGSYWVSNWVDVPYSSPISYSKSISVTLKEARLNTSTWEFSNDLEGSETSYIWYGARTRYIDGRTGTNTTTEVVTDDTGLAVRQGSHNIPMANCRCKFTIRENLTNAQSAVYSAVTANPLVKTVSPGNQFVFENRRHEYPHVKVKKTTDNTEEGAISGISFVLSGTKTYGNTRVEIPASTDENGEIDFGEIWPGEYVIEETGFDKLLYDNKYPLAGYENPAQKITITSSDSGAKTVTFDNQMKKSILIRKVDKQSGAFLRNAEFELYEESALAARFRITKDTTGTPAAKILWTNGQILTDQLEFDEAPDDDEPEEYDPADDDSSQAGPDAVDADDSDPDASGDDTPEGEDISDDSMFVKITGLSVGKSYRLVETAAPEGYFAEYDETFTYAEGMKITVENDMPFHDVRVMKDVTGDLGDLTKEFEYTVRFTGLQKNKSYMIVKDGESGTFSSDGSGNAAASFRLKDGEEVLIKNIIRGATYQVTEAASDHVSQYQVFSENMQDDGAVITDPHGTNAGRSAEDLTTAIETVDSDDGTVVVYFRNNRDLATVTGSDDYSGIWFASAVVTAVIAVLFCWSIHRRKKTDSEDHQ